MMEREMLRAKLADIERLIEIEKRDIPQTPEADKEREAEQTPLFPVTARKE